MLPRHHLPRSLQAPDSCFWLAHVLVLPSYLPGCIFKLLILRPRKPSQPSLMPKDRPGQGKCLGVPQLSGHSLVDSGGLRVGSLAGCSEVQGRL